jgi:hypothetical protein
VAITELAPSANTSRNAKAINSRLLERMNHLKGESKNLSYCGDYSRREFSKRHSARQVYFELAERFPMRHAVFAWNSGKTLHIFVRSLQIYAQLEASFKPAAPC